MEKETVVLIVGHNSASKGAYSNVLKMSEYDYNLEVANKVLAKQSELKYNIRVLFRKPNPSYSYQMRELLGELDKEKYKVAVELHFNAPAKIEDTETNGALALCYYKNEKAKEIINKYFEAIKKYRPNHIIRGIIPSKTEKDRGGYGICNSKGTYILVEPFFANNKENVLSIDEYVEVLITFINSL